MVRLWERFYFFEHARTCRDAVFWLFLFHSPFSPKNKGQRTNNQPIISVSVLMMVFFLGPFGCSISLFSSFFLCKASRIIIFDFFHLPHLLFLSDCSLTKEKLSYVHPARLPLFLSSWRGAEEDWAHYPNTDVRCGRNKCINISLRQIRVERKPPIG